MKFLRGSSIQRKQTGVVMITGAAALVLAYLGFGLFDFVTSKRDMVGDLATHAQIMGKNTRPRPAN